MPRETSLADALGGIDPRPPEKQAEPSSPTVESLLDVTDPTEFCQKILESREFRQYIVNGITLCDLPPAVMCRILDHAWGKPAERVEVQGAVTIKRVVREVIASSDATVSKATSVH